MIQLKAFLKRRVVLFSLLAGGIFFMLGLLVSTQVPKIRAFILVKIEQVSREQLPVRILPGQIDLHFFPLGATLQNVRILPKPETEAYLESIQIEQITVSASPWLLLQGRFRLSDVEINGAYVAAKIPPLKKSGGPPLAGLFDTIAQVPIHRMTLANIGARLELQDPESPFVVELSDLSLEVEKRRGGIISVSLPSVVALARPADSNQSLRLEAEGAALLSRETLGLSSLKIRRGDSYLHASGKAWGDVEALKFKRIEASAKSELHLESLRNWAAKSIAQLADMPTLKGRAYVDAKVRQQTNQTPEAQFEVRTEGFQESKMFLDRISLKGSYKDHQVDIPELVLDNPAGIAKVSEIKAKIGETSTFSGRVTTDNLQVHELLKSLGVGELPVFLQVSGDMPCQGQVTPSAKPFRLLVNCKGKVKTENLLVRDSMQSRGTIVAVRNLSGEGEVTIDENKVTYSTELSAPNSKGRSRGEISYAKGFQISFEADKLTTSDIANLADLKIDGSLKLKGTTEGDSHRASVTIDADGTDLWLDDYWLGQARGNVAYKAGLLSFTNFQGYYTVSRYQGEVVIDLPKKEISVTARAPFVDARDLLKAFSRRVTLPIAVTGTGQAQVRVTGPLEFTKLTYDLRTSLFRGSIAGETFDQAHFDVKANRGEVRAERVQLLKGPSLISLSGTGHPNGTIKTQIQGRSLRLEDSTTVSSSGLALSGVLNFDMDMSGKVLAPETEMRGSITQTAIGDQGVPDSKFVLRFNSQTVEGEGNFLGDVVGAKFVVPMTPAAPFALKIDTKEWNYAPIFAAISGPTSRKDYEGRLTSQVDLTAQSGGFWNSTGSIKINNFSLTRGPLALKSKEPLGLSIKSGQIHVEKFELLGDGTFLRIADNQKPVSKLDLLLNGKLDLNLLALLTPFFEELRGSLAFAVNVRGGPGTAEVLGSAYVDKGYLKFFDFPHSIEDIQVDALFSQKKVLFNTVKAELGGGRISASGGMEMKGYKNYPVNVSGSFEKITLNIPTKVRTTGSGTASFTGNWFPFVLKADYNVRDGLITKEFGEDSESSGSGIRRDFFLPEVLVQENFTPLLVDLQIGFPGGIDVKNESVDGRVSGALSVKGKPTKPSILGSVKTEKESKIYFKDTAFDVTTGNIQWSDPNEIFPKLYVAARTRVQEYDVNLLIQGPASKPDFALTSVPPLENKDIVSLLALGTTDTKLSTVTRSQEQQASTGYQISASALKNNPISKAIKSNFGFDVQFSPGFDDTGNSAVQKIIVSRQFSPKVGVSASQAFGKARETEAKVKYRLNDRVSLIGSWLGRDYEETTDQTSIQKNPNKLGLDIEYKFEFR